MKNLTTLTQVNTDGNELNLKQLATVGMTLIMNNGGITFVANLPFLVAQEEWNALNTAEKWDVIKKRFGMSFIGLYTDPQEGTGMAQVHITHEGTSGSAGGTIPDCASLIAEKLNSAGEAATIVTRAPSYTSPNIQSINFTTRSAPVWGYA